MWASQLHGLPTITPRGTSHKAPSNLPLTLLVNTLLLSQTRTPQPLLASSNYLSTPPFPNFPHPPKQRLLLLSLINI